MQTSISPPTPTPTPRSQEERPSFVDRRTAVFEKIDRHLLNAQGSRREVFEELSKSVRMVMDSSTNLDYAERLFNRVIVEDIDNLTGLSSILPTHLRIGKLACSHPSHQLASETAQQADSRQFKRHEPPRSRSAYN